MLPNIQDWFQQHAVLLLQESYKYSGQWAPKTQVAAVIFVNREKALGPLSRKALSLNLILSKEMATVVKVIS